MYRDRLRSLKWHHLDDDDRNSIFVNIVPVRADLNTSLRDMAIQAKKGAVVLPVALLSPKTLHARANFCAGIWKSGAAYGAARLGAFVAKYQKNWEEGVMLSCEAVYHARHRLDYELIEDTLRRSILPEVSQDRLLPPEVVFRLCREIGGIFAEHGSNTEALGVYGMIEGVKIDSNSAMAALLRRQATSEAARSGMNRMSEALLKEAQGLSVGDINHVVSVANTYAWILIASGSHRKAFEHLGPVVDLLDKKIFKHGADQPVAMALTGWNAAELYHNYALALCGTKCNFWKKRMNAAMKKAEKIFQKSGAAFYEIREGVVLDVLKKSQISAPYAKMRSLPASLRKLMETVVNAVNRR